MKYHDLSFTTCTKCSGLHLKPPRAIMSTRNSLKYHWDVWLTPHKRRLFLWCGIRSTNMCCQDETVKYIYNLIVTPYSSSVAFICSAMGGTSVKGCILKMTKVSVVMALPLPQLWDDQLTRGDDSHRCSFLLSNDPIQLDHVSRLGHAVNITWWFNQSLRNRFRPGRGLFIPRLLI